MRSVVFRVRKPYFEAIVRGDKHIEYREASRFWTKRLRWSDLMNGPPHVAVFICGKKVHRRKIVRITLIATPSWFSNQGKKDVSTPTCFAIYLGEVFHKCPDCGRKGPK